MLLANCSSENAKPIADFSYEPQVGNTRSQYYFDASVSINPTDSLESLQFRWDWESDLNWDTDFSSVPHAVHQFSEGGTKKVRLEIKDSKGNFDFVERVIQVIQITSGSFTDPRDHQAYEWIKMGDQTWMAENLKWNAGAGSKDSRRSQYGRYYNWETALEACPAGWHLPSDREWAGLESNYGMPVWNRSAGFDESGEIGYKFKSRSGWYARCNGTNEYEFNVVPAGYWNYDGRYARNSLMSYFWTSTAVDERHAINRGFHYASKGISRDPEDKRVFFSVRCIKDADVEVILPITSLLSR